MRIWRDILGRKETKESLSNHRPPRTGPNLSETYACDLCDAVRNLKSSPRHCQNHGRSAHAAWHFGRGFASSSEVPFGASTLPRKCVAERKPRAGGSNPKLWESADWVLGRRWSARGKRLPAPPRLVQKKIRPSAMEFASFCSPTPNNYLSTSRLAHNWPQLCAAVTEPLNLD